METISSVAHEHKHVFGKDFQDILTKMNERMDVILHSSGPNVILYKVDTDTSDIWDVYLGLIKTYGGSVMTNHFTCSTCRKMVEKFGNVVTIDEDGSIIPVMWGGYSHELNSVLSRVHGSIHDYISKQKVVSEWYSSETYIGSPSTPGKNGEEWTHMSVAIPSVVWQGANAHSLIAKSKERFRGLMNDDTGIHRIPLHVIGAAIRFFRENELNRSERFLAPAEFHYSIKEMMTDSENKNSARAKLWYKLSRAPEGWQNVNSTMIGQLYSWIKDGVDLSEIKRRWNTNTSGENYQRPKAVPSEQTIKQAEELVEKLGIESALHRRFARLEEVDCFWKPTVSQKEESNVGGVFSKIKPKNDSTVVKPYEYETSEKKITWEKFVENVLPATLSMRLLALPHGGYCALTTQTNADAPPIFYWDREEKRYPISAYVYSGGSPARMWGLEPTTFVDVTGITKIPGHDEAYVLILKDCADKNTNQGIGLFPENMRSEFHGVRSVIEAYSQSEQLSGREEASACGYQVAGQGFNVKVEVTTSEGVRKYHIDRKD